MNRRIFCDKNESCRGLSEFIQERSSYGGGIVMKTIMDMRHPRGPFYSMYVVRARASDKGILLNYCPFCGRRKNHRWTSGRRARGEQKSGKGGG